MYRWISQDRLPTSFLQQLATFPWYDSTQINDLTPRIQPGTAWYDTANGNAFAYVKAGAALANGQFVAKQVPATGPYIAAPTGNGSNGVAADNKCVLSITGSASLTTNAEIGNWIWIENGGTQAAPGPTIRKIKGNTSGTTPNITIAVRDLNSTLSQYDADVFATALTSGSTYLSPYIRPNTVVVCTATLVPCGMALGTVTSGYYTIIQIMGLALGQADGVTNGAIVAGMPCVVNTTGAMAAIGTQATATNVGAPTNVYAGAGLIEPLVLHSTSSTTPYLIPAYINLIGNL